VEPDGCIAAFTGDAAAQRRLAAAHQASRVDFPRGLKEMMSARFGTSPVCRVG
jgi:4-hydroxy-tetrahydrodipicolinate synthase